MNALTSFFGPTYDDILAGLRMQFSIVEQPRDDAGRYVSRRDLVRKELEARCARLTPSQRRAMIDRAATVPLTGHQRSKGFGI